MGSVRRGLYVDEPVRGARLVYRSSRAQTSVTSDGVKMREKRGVCGVPWTG